MLVFFRSGHVFAHDLQTKEDNELRTVPGPDIALFPSGTQLAVVVDRDPGGDPEGYGDPQIVVMDVRGDEQTVIGPGRDPHWSADGSQIAAITEDGIVAYDAQTANATPVFEGEVWDLFGWSAEGVAAVGPDGPTVTIPGEGSTFLDVPASETWGISPTEAMVLTTDKTRVTAVAETGETTMQATLEGALGDGAWSPDGSLIAAVLIGRGTQVGVLHVANGDVDYLDGGVGAQGNVVWAADSTSFAFVRVDPKDKLKLQSVVCDVNGPCEPQFSWTQGVVLLGFAKL
jgi:Tol biopolymer transport system component